MKKQNSSFDKIYNDLKQLLIKEIGDNYVEFDYDLQKITDIYLKIKNICAFGIAYNEKITNLLQFSVVETGMFLSLLSTYSLSLSWLMMQHFSSIRRLSDSAQNDLQIKKIKKLHSEKTGVAIFILKNVPFFNIKKENDKIIANGIIPWCTGYKILDKICIIDTKSDENYNDYYIVPFKADNEKFIIKQLDLFTPNGSNTVSIVVKDYDITQYFFGSFKKSNKEVVHGISYVGVGVRNQIFKNINLDFIKKNNDLFHKYLKLKKDSDKMQHTIFTIDNHLITGKQNNIYRCKNYILTLKILLYYQLTLKGKALLTNSKVYYFFQRLSLLTVSTNDHQVQITIDELIKNNPNLEE